MRRVVIGARLGPAQIWRIRSFQLPVYLITRLAVLLGGRSEFSARFPSAMAGILGIVMIYRVGKLLYGEEESLLAAFMLAALSFHVRWSRDEGPYALMIFLSLLTLFFLLKALRENKSKWWIGFTLASILNIYNHTYTLFVLASEMTFAGLVILERRLVCLKDVSLPWSSRLKDTLRSLSPYLLSSR